MMIDRTLFRIKSIIIVGEMIRLHIFFSQTTLKAFFFFVFIFFLHNVTIMVLVVDVVVIIIIILLIVLLVMATNRIRCITSSFHIYLRPVLRISR